ncbi:MAG: mobile mystery protein A [Flavobacteriales bacterium]|nr:mobile mystery protein A [Flavobacteriales bacterium]
MRTHRLLFVSQFDKRTEALRYAARHGIPSGGWLRSLRHGLGFTLDQLAKRMGVSRQHIGQVESREAQGTISLNSLREVAHALDMDLYYAFVPKDGSLQALIERRAFELAREVVMRTHQSMTLEGQAVSDERLKEAIEEQAAELRREMPKQLWD